MASVIRGSDNFDSSALFDFSQQSLTTSGYQQLPNGLIIQWGTSAAIVRTSTTVTFPIAFPTEVVAVTSTQVAANTGDWWGHTIGTPGLSSFAYYNHMATATAIKWIAIGY